MGNSFTLHEVIMDKYDFIVVGAGLFGAVFAHEVHKYGKKVLVLEKKKHVGGLCYTEKMADINVHKYGPHIFHTSDRDVWHFVNEVHPFHSFVYSPLAFYKNRLFNLPFNMNTFHQLWGVITPEEAYCKLKEQTAKYADLREPKNLEEQALALVGDDIYKILIKGYTEKQWGRRASELPAFIIRRLPVRFSYDNNYYNDIYQGIPQDGYTSFIKALLQDVECHLDTDFFSVKEFVLHSADKIIYTGMIDLFFDCCFGSLEYRSVKFEHNVLSGCRNFQGVAVVNFTDASIPYTRRIEHKYFERGEQADTVISYEYPEAFVKDNAYYPIQNDRNNLLYERYHAFAEEKVPNVEFCGRLGEYKYYNMDQIVEKSLNLVRKMITGG